MTEIDLMKSLIDYTRERALENRTFTGAFVVKNGEVIQKTVTSIEPDDNPLAHAELKALQGAIGAYGSEALEGCHLYTTQQPCPMCASAMAWSGIAKVVYGLPSSHQWGNSDNGRKFLADLGIECFGPVLEQECRAIDEYLIANGI